MSYPSSQPYPPPSNNASMYYAPPQAAQPYQQPSSSSASAYQPSAPPAYAETEESLAYHRDGADDTHPDLQHWKGIVAFDDSVVRHGFIRKVYSILTLQLLVTLGFICIFLFVDSVKHYVQRSQGLFISAWVLTIVFLIALACFETIRRQTPYNYIFLGLFTLCEAYLLGVVSSYYNVDAVLIAVGITAFVTVALTIFAFQTKWDFTGHGVYLFVFLLVLIAFGFVCAIIRSDIARIAYAALGALVFSMYLVYDTQLLLGGNHKISLSPEEWVFAALNLYLDIVNLFLFILSLVGRR